MKVFFFLVRVSLKEATWAWMSLPPEEFSQLKDFIASFIASTLVLLYSKQSVYKDEDSVFSY